MKRRPGHRGAARRLHAAGHELVSTIGMHNGTSVKMNGLGFDLLPPELRLLPNFVHLRSRQRLRPFSAIKNLAAVAAIGSQSRTKPGQFVTDDMTTRPVPSARGRKRLSGLNSASNSIEQEKLFARMTSSIHRFVNILNPFKTKESTAASARALSAIHFLQTRYIHVAVSSFLHTSCYRTLRPVSTNANMDNCIGVCREPGGRWESYVYCNRKKIFLGNFEKKEDAASAHDYTVLNIHREVEGVTTNFFVPVTYSRELGFVQGLPFDQLVAMLRMCATLLRGCAPGAAQGPLLDESQEPTLCRIFKDTADFAASLAELESQEGGRKGGPGLCTNSLALRVDGMALDALLGGLPVGICGGCRRVDGGPRTEFQQSDVAVGVSRVQKLLCSSCGRPSSGTKAFLLAFRKAQGMMRQASVQGSRRHAAHKRKSIVMQNFPPVEAALAAGDVSGDSMGNNGSGAGNHVAGGSIAGISHARALEYELLRSTKRRGLACMEDASSHLSSLVDAFGGLDGGMIKGGGGGIMDVGHHGMSGGHHGSDLSALDGVLDVDGVTASLLAAQQRATREARCSTSSRPIGYYSASNAAMVAGVGGTGGYGNAGGMAAALNTSAITHNLNSSGGNTGNNGSINNNVNNSGNGNSHAAANSLLARGHAHALHRPESPLEVLPSAGAAGMSSELSPDCLTMGEVSWDSSCNSENASVAMAVPVTDGGSSTLLTSLMQDWECGAEETLQHSSFCSVLSTAPYHAQGQPALLHQEFASGMDLPAAQVAPIRSQVVSDPSSAMLMPCLTSLDTLTAMPGAPASELVRRCSVGNASACAGNHAGMNNNAAEGGGSLASCLDDVTLTALPTAPVMSSLSHGKGGGFHAAHPAASTDPESCAWPDMEAFEEAVCTRVPSASAAANASVSAITSTVCEPSGSGVCRGFRGGTEDLQECATSWPVLAASEGGSLRHGGDDFSEQAAYAASRGYQPMSVAANAPMFMSQKPHWQAMAKPCSWAAREELCGTAGALVRGALAMDDLFSDEDLDGIFPVLKGRKVIDTGCGVGTHMPQTGGVRVNVYTHC
eukprot:jgi/Mesvir1/14493/Mv05194-RA.1